MWIIGSRRKGRCTHGVANRWSARACIRTSRGQLSCERARSGDDDAAFAAIAYLRADAGGRAVTATPNARDTARTHAHAKARADFFSSSSPTLPATSLLLAAKQSLCCYCCWLRELTLATHLHDNGWVFYGQFLDPPTRESFYISLLNISATGTRNIFSYAGEQFSSLRGGFSRRGNTVYRDNSPTEVIKGELENIARPQETNKTPRYTYCLQVRVYAGKTANAQTKKVPWVEGKKKRDK